MYINKEFELQFEIEPLCLLDCLHCSSYNLKNVANRAYSDDDILNFLSYFRGPTHIYFTGGDPILYPNILNLCKQIKNHNKNISIGLYTSGNCNNMQPISISFATLLSEAGVNDCYLSIYSDTPYEHDFFTNSIGSHENTLCSVNNLALAGIHPKAHIVLTKYNIDKVDRLINFCNEANFSEIRFLKLIPSGKALINWYQIGTAFSHQDKIVESIMSQKELYGIPISVSGYPHIHPCRTMNNATKCQAGTNLLYINSVGDAYPCACTLDNNTEYNLGNISHPKKILQNLQLKYSRNFNDKCLKTTRM